MMESRMAGRSDPAHCEWFPCVIPQRKEIYSQQSPAILFLFQYYALKLFELQSSVLYSVENDLKTHFKVIYIVGAFFFSSLNPILADSPITNKSADCNIFQKHVIRQAWNFRFISISVFISNDAESLETRLCEMICSNLWTCCNTVCRYWHFLYFVELLRPALPFSAKILLPLQKRADNVRLNYTSVIRWRTKMDESHYLRISKSSLHLCVFSGIQSWHLQVIQVSLIYITNIH